MSMDVVVRWWRSLRVNARRLEQELPPLMVGLAPQSAFALSQRHAECYDYAPCVPASGSVFRALSTLERRGVVQSSQQGSRRLYGLSEKAAGAGGVRA